VACKFDSNLLGAHADNLLFNLPNIIAYGERGPQISGLARRFKTFQAVETGGVS
jgi:hypothetical protein